MSAIRSELVAVLIAVQDEEPLVLTLDQGRNLPSGPLETGHRSLQRGMRLWVEQQTQCHLGHIEQLYTFAEALDATEGPDEPRLIRISYMGLTRLEDAQEGWRGLYEYFPWESWRENGAESLNAEIARALSGWAGRDAARQWRCAETFGLDGQPWNDELVLHRYELLWEAELLPESRNPGVWLVPGRSMPSDRRRILATALARLRAKIRYRPVVFELMPETFTLWQLQRTVEAIAGRPLHKQNFRRLILAQELVEETGEAAVQPQGRPARLYRFRREVIGTRQLMGSKLPIARSA
ncbi:NUDIX hydrolase [Asaia krungthepensis]|uniref:NrtR DNA-binding winged helix domain-containing protein n=1 Tax=Asaia krungthepensis NRIC 0535 TaxID=1307925 RepID=A0ABQ0PYW8_9PROT|nr:hypothetical protein [Asaia krungthepensis]GBQ85025.1 hypothetical protein AA0535_0654 [Asaia krungthepensis NRIC 0535]